MAKRMKKAVSTTIETREQLEERMGEYAEVVSSQAAMAAELQLKVTALRAEYEQGSALLAEKAEALFADIAAWAALHPELFAGSRKSLDTIHGTLGYRTGMPRCTLPRGVDEQELCHRMLALSAVEGCVRRCLAVDKARCIEIFSHAGSDELSRTALAVLEGLGLRVTQTERFYVECYEEGGAK